MSDIGEGAEEDEEEEEDEIDREMEGRNWPFAGNSYRCGAGRRPSSGAVAAGRAATACSEVILLRRAEDRRRFRSAAAALAARRPRPRGAVAGDEEEDDHVVVDHTGLDVRMNPELTIAGVLGPSAAQSLVRQALLAELGGDPAILGGDSGERGCNRPTSSMATALGAEVSREASIARLASRLTGLQAQVASSPPPPETGTATKGQDASETLDARDVLRRASGDEPPGGGANRALFATESATFGADDGARAAEDTAFAEEAEAELLRVERLETLRAAVLGVLSSSPSQPPMLGQPRRAAGGGGGGEGCGGASRGGGSDAAAPAATDLVDAARPALVPWHGPSGGWGPAEARRLDEMRREALDDLCGRLLVQEGLCDNGGGRGDAAVQRGLEGWPGRPGDPRQGPAGCAPLAA